MDQQAGNNHRTPQSIYDQGQGRFFVVNLHLHRVVLVLSIDFGTLCVWDASVMDFGRRERGRGYEFHGSNNYSC